MSEFSLDEFAADFLEEADQHLQLLSNHLLALENSTSGGSLRGTVDEMFRSFHTLKGLCGMVGLQAATDVSHQAESLLSRVRRHEADLSGAMVDVLLSAVASLQSIVETVRHPNLPLPQVGPVLAGMAALQGVPPALAASPSAAPEDDSIVARVARALTAEDQADIERRVGDGADLALATFIPTPERASQGLNVSTVRQRLSQTATLIKALPLMEGRSVRFAFLLMSAAPLPRDPTLELDWHAISAADLGLAVDAPEPLPALASRRAVGSVRVDIPRLDDLMRLVGEMVTSRHRIEARNALARDPHLDEAVSRMGRQLRDLRDAVTRLRLVPVSEVFGRMPLAVRDLARSLNLQVQLVLKGETTQVDKALVERLLDPLLHLVRNALSHGIEPPDIRLAAGKPAVGTVALTARSDGESLVVRVQDDGRGLDRDAILARARRLEWQAPNDDVSDDELLDLLCRPGFSTQSKADTASGRGVGLDVVLQAVRTMGGTMAVETEPLVSTAFILRLPLGLSIVDVVLVEAGGETYGVPRTEVATVIEIAADAIRRVEGAELLAYRGRALRLFELSRLFGLPPAVNARDHEYGLVYGEEGEQSALRVDRLIGMQEVVVRTITDPLIARPGIAGATELGSGAVVLILDFPRLIRYAWQGRGEGVRR